MKQERAGTQSAVERIRAVFLELLTDRPLGRITVTQICREAGINRTTFYKHYLDVFDLMDKTEQDLLSSYQEAVGRIRMTGVVPVLTEMLQILRQNMEHYWPLFGKNGDPSFSGRLIGSVYPLFADNPMFADSRKYDDDVKKLLYCYLSGGCTAMLTYWVQYGKTRSPEEMAVVMDELIRITMTGVKEHFADFAGRTERKIE
ncbi:MAG: TetR/AcrR family transcriptional regulator [Lachnospiraceae bacterium]